MAVVPSIDCCLAISIRFSCMLTCRFASDSNPSRPFELVEAWRIPLPPVDLQHQFAAKADAVRGITTQQAAALWWLQATFDALLHQPSALKPNGDLRTTWSIDNLRLGLEPHSFQTGSGLTRATSGNSMLRTLRRMKNYSVTCRIALMRGVFQPSDACKLYFPKPGISSSRIRSWSFETRLSTRLLRIPFARGACASCPAPLQQRCSVICMPGWLAWF